MEGFEVNMKIRKQLTSTKHSYGRKNKKLFITVHQTGNTSKGANAAAHANLQSNGNVRGASWHWQVDDKEAVQSFTHDWQLWHAGDGRGNGNLTSIAIEMCVNSDGNYAKALNNLITLIKKIMKDEGISETRVVQHNHWSGKNCPAQIRGRGEWSKIKNAIGSSKPAPAPKPTPKPKPVPPAGNKSIAQMAAEVIAGRHGNGHANRRKSLGISSAQYERVRAEVNRQAGVSSKPKPKPSGKSVATMAAEVIAGKHGNGHTNRRKSLGISASEYAKVRAEVNRRAGGGKVSTPKGKSVSQMATEVIQGKHGNGHANRRKSLGVSDSVYQKVRAEVNRRS